MLPPKMGEGVFGLSSGGVKPTGAVFSSVAQSLIERRLDWGKVSGLRGLKGMVVPVRVAGEKKEVDAWAAIDGGGGRVERVWKVASDMVEKGRREWDLDLGCVVLHGFAW